MEHWDNIYSTKDSREVSWYRPHLHASLALIEGLELDDPSACAVLDVGGGASSLALDLWARGFRDLTVLDISARALELAQQDCGAAAPHIRWIVGDVTRVALPRQRYALWHDRAVFHFLADAEREAYVGALKASLRAGGYAIVAPFGPDGPPRCSGLAVQRYSAASLQAALGADLRLVESRLDWHTTPSGARQQFLYCVFRYEPAADQ